MHEPATILIVDDQRETRVMLAESLRTAGYAVLAAERGDDALRLAAAQPALIVLDIVLPDMDGFDVCRRLKADSATQPIPVIFVTALNEHADKVQGFDAGGVDYLTKPFQCAELLARVNTHLLLRQCRQRIAVIRRRACRRKRCGSWPSTTGRAMCASCKMCCTAM